MDTISFPPEVLERIIPDLSLERHLKSGIRPNFRNFEEFRNIELLKIVSNEKLTTLYIRNGITLIVTTITYTINEVMNYSPGQFASVSPSISISRGRTISGAPTDEEMNLCQALYEILLSQQILPLDSLIFKPHLKVNDEFIDSEQQQDFESKKYKFNLVVNFKVFGRSGPLFDILYYALIKALMNVKLPMIYIDDDLENKDKLLVNPAIMNPLTISLDPTSIPISSNFGIADIDNENLILCDIENESEESNIITKSSIISNGDTLSSFNFINGNLLAINKDDIKKMIKLSNARSKNLNKD